MSEHLKEFKLTCVACHRENIRLHLRPLEIETKEHNTKNIQGLIDSWILHAESCYECNLAVEEEIKNMEERTRKSLPQKYITRPDGTVVLTWI